MKARPWLQGIGLSLLYLLPPITVVLAPGHRNFFHQYLPVTTLARGLTLDLLFLGILGGLYFWLLDTARRSSVRDFGWIPMLMGAAWVVARDCGFFVGDTSLHGRILILVRYVPVIVLVLACLIRWLFPRLFGRLTRATGVALAAAAFALVIALPQLLYNCFNRGPAEMAAFQKAPRQPSQPGEKRIIWLLFDELSYDQVFEHRASSLALPAFDQLAKESIYFDNLRPAGYRTDVVIPALFMGEPFEDIKSGNQGSLLWRSAVDAPWQQYDPSRTIFAQAQKLGWSTAVAGWYNPYCRILAPVLDRCYWTYSESMVEELFVRLSTRQSTLANAALALPFAGHFQRQSQHASAAEGHLYDYTSLMDEAGAIIADPAIRFAFIHLPVPHMPVIYQRPGVAAGHRGSYLDNLALTNDALARLRAAIAASPDAASTVLIVSSDHSWRTQLARGSVDWTAEDERITHGGVFDDRPVLMVHYPGAHAADIISEPVNAMAVHTLLLDLLSGKIGDADALNTELRGQAGATGTR